MGRASLSFRLQDSAYALKVIPVPSWRSALTDEEGKPVELEPGTDVDVSIKSDDAVATS